MHKYGYVYIMASPNKAVLYVGVTSDLLKRVWQHRNKFYPGFSEKYNCVILLYYCQLSTIGDAIIEEKRLKGGNRKQKEKLIDSLNPEWNDLWDSISK